MQKIVTFLWFDGQAEEAVKFYTSLFKDSKIVTIARYPDSVPGLGGKVLTAVFELNGQRFMALDGGPQFKFNEAVSLFINCDNQEEIDHFWNKLTADGGKEGNCGWLKDKFGLSWQVVPASMGELMQPADPSKGGRAIQALMQMSKISIKTLEEA
jgi:predicted 3-demethylubiquinone-9 3-methyltransferase (glyoxalase superfamily)